MIHGPGWGPASPPFFVEANQGEFFGRRLLAPAPIGVTRDSVQWDRVAIYGPAEMRPLSLLVQTRGELGESPGPLATRDLWCSPEGFQAAERQGAMRIETVAGSLVCDLRPGLYQLPASPWCAVSVARWNRAVDEQDSTPPLAVSLMLQPGTGARATPFTATGARFVNALATLEVPDGPWRELRLGLSEIGDPTEWQITGGIGAAILAFAPPTDGLPHVYEVTLPLGRGILRIDPTLGTGNVIAEFRE